ncbi:hypothetical protein NKH77_48160 [Streptomyces sp. M19]
MAKLFGLDRGEPGNPVAKKALEPTLDEAGRAMLGFSEEMAAKVGRTRRSPQGASDVDALLKRHYQQMLAKDASPEEAARGSSTR